MLGGGIGFLTRMRGATSDNLLGLELVDARGRLLRADDSQNADLFWACRGGGGSFGVVTVLDLVWSLAQAASALSAWQVLAPFWPDELTSSLQINGTPDGAVTLDGLFLGDMPGLQPLLDSFLAAAPPSKVHLMGMTYLEAAEHFSGELPLPSFMAMAKSDYVVAPLPAAAIDVLLQWLAISPNEEAALQFQAYGGAVNRVPSDATAFPHRQTLFSMQYITHWADPGDEAASTAWLRGFYAAMCPYVSGAAYSDMCDLGLTDWQHAYYGANHERLVAVKSVYDPDDVFHFVQSIPSSQ